MVDSQTMLTYESSDDVANAIIKVLIDSDRMTTVADAGSALMRQRYNKQKQWQDFEQLVASI